MTLQRQNVWKVLGEWEHVGMVQQGLKKQREGKGDWKCWVTYIST